MQLDQINGDHLIQYLPHRGRNLLLDTVDRSETPEGPQAKISLQIKHPDVKKRDIFLEKNSSGSPIYSPYMFAEFLALGSIVLLTDLPPGTMAYFSTITNYTRTGNVAANGPLKGETIRNKDRGLFKRFAGKILDANQNSVAETDIMAFAFNPQTDANREEKKLTEKPHVHAPQPIQKKEFDWKPAEMVFVNSIVSVDVTQGCGLFGYTYPETHPFVEGHFPNNPIMMGITQWEGCGDAMTLLAKEAIQKKKISAAQFQAAANIEVIKPDGTVACDVKGMSLKFKNRGASVVPYGELTATKRVGFRDIVRPKETLYFRVTDFQIQN